MGTCPFERRQGCSDVNPRPTLMKKLNSILTGILAASLAVTASAVMVSAEGEEDNSLTLETAAPVVEVTTEATETEPAATEPVTTIVTTSNGSPKTGQGAYALAAIPVGLLAAAAIVKSKGKDDIDH